MIASTSSAVLIHIFEGDSMSTKAVPAIIFSFVVGGLVGYGLSTGKVWTAAAALADAVPALADAVPIPDAHQGEITFPTPIPTRPPSQDIAKSAGTPVSPTATPTQTHTTEPPVTLATRSPEATKSPAAPLIEHSPTRKPRKHQSDTNERHRRGGDTVSLKAHNAAGTTAVARVGIFGSADISAYTAPPGDVAEQPNIPLQPPIPTLPLPIPLPVPTLPLPVPLPLPLPTIPVPTIPVPTSTMTAPVLPPR